jgi:hypothetical protein
MTVLSSVDLMDHWKEHPLAGPMVKLLVVSTAWPTGSQKVDRKELMTVEKLACLKDVLTVPLMDESSAALMAFLTVPLKVGRTAGHWVDDWAATTVAMSVGGWAVQSGVLWANMLAVQ